MRMRLWTVVFGILVCLQMAWTQPGWAQGDVGSEVCRDVQLQVQQAVGNETDPPYKNHGAYVKAAAHAANPALESGEITEACHECIVSQFAQSIPIINQNPCGVGLCGVPGGPGWQNEVHAGGGVALTGATTAQDCCRDCVANPDCTQWAFFLGSPCELNVPPDNACTGPLVSVIDSGRIRCPGE